MLKIKVKPYMTKPSTPEFDFHTKFNSGIPMPMRIMVGHITKETKGMYQMELHADIIENEYNCIKCGKQLTNSVSRYFGIGPECGGHNYVNPFNTEEELQAAIQEMKQQLNNITWTGWVIKSAILEMVDLDGQNNNVIQLEQKRKEKTIINIDIRDSKKLNGEQSLFVTFPYNPDLVTLMRGLPIRYWHPDTKEWELPPKNLAFLQENLLSYTLTITGELKSSTKEDRQESVEIIPEGFQFKTKPFQHQIEGLVYGLNYDKFLLADEQGIGKSKQAIDIAVANKLRYGYKHVLVIVGVNGLKWNWQKEVETHSNEESHILGQVYNDKKGWKIGGNKDKLQDLINLPDTYFLITNIESLRDEEIANKLDKLCKDGTIGMVILDEAHRCKNPQAKQTKGLLKLKTKTQIAMTGTPLMNQPLDLYTVLHWLGYEKHSFYQFKKYHCVMGGYGGYEVIAYKNLSEIQEQLQEMMLRRRKEDVLDLPEKIYQTEYVEMSKEQKKIYDEIHQEIKQDIDKIKIGNNPLERLIRLRQATGYTGILSQQIMESAKLDRMEELVEDIINDGRKVLIFSNWTQITDQIQQRLKQYNPAVITGQTKDEDRKHEQDRFQNDEKCQVLIGTIGAMGTGLTLTAATVEIFVDHSWNYATYEQAIDRAHRIGQGENLTIVNLITKDTIDERIFDLMFKKKQMSDLMVDGEVNKINPDIIDYLLS